MTRNEKNIVMFLYDNTFLFNEIISPFSSDELLKEYNKDRMWYKFQFLIRQGEIDQICENLITKYRILDRCNHPQNEDPYHLNRLYLGGELRIAGNRLELQKYGFLITPANFVSSIVTIVASIVTIVSFLFLKK